MRHNSIYGTIEGVLGPVFSVVISPIIIFYIGIESFGIYALSLSITGFGSIASFGMSTVATSKASGIDDIRYCKGEIFDLRACFTFAVCSSLFVSLIAFIFSDLLVSFLVPEGYRYSIELIACIQIASVLLFIQEIDGVISGALKGLEKFKLLALTELCYRFLLGGSLILLCYLLSPPVNLLQMMLLLATLKLWFKFSTIYNIFGLIFFRPNFSVEGIKSVTEIGFWVWTQSLGGILLSVFDRAIVSRLFGVSSAGIYSLCLSLAQFLHLFFASAFQFLLPYFTRQLKSYEVNSSISILKVIAISSTLTLVISICFYYISPLLVAIWLGSDFSNIHIGVYQSLIVAYSFLALTVSSHYLLLSVKRFRYIALSNLAGGILAIVLSLYFSGFGIDAFALSKSTYGIVLLFHFYMVWLSFRK